MVWMSEAMQGSGFRDIISVETVGIWCMTSSYRSKLQEAALRSLLRMNPKPQNPKPYTAESNKPSSPEAQGPKLKALNPQPSTPNPKLRTLIPKPESLNTLIPNLQRPKVLRLSAIKRGPDWGFWL